MKHPFRFGFLASLGALLCAVLVLSVFFSVVASVDPAYCAEGGGIEDRLGLVIVQVLELHENEQGELEDQLGYTYSGDGEGWMILVYNPFTTYFDDVIARWDF